MRCECTATQLSIWSYRGHIFAAATGCVLPGPRTSKVRGNYVRETSGKRRNNIVQEITQNVANVFSFNAIIVRTWFFNALTFARSPGEVLKTAAFGLGFQHLPRDLANVNAWKTMFDPCTIIPHIQYLVYIICYHIPHICYLVYII